MTDLAAWLLARIADDEAVARDATTLGYGWDADGLAGDVYASGDDPQTGTVVAECGDHNNARHIARYDPARVLADCEAKRLIVELHPPGEHDCGEGIDWNSGANTCATLRALALPYADCGDYRQEWRP